VNVRVCGTDRAAGKWKLPKLRFVPGVTQDRSRRSRVDTATGGPKPAIVETGPRSWFLRLPLFIHDLGEKHQDRHAQRAAISAGSFPEAPCSSDMDSSIVRRRLEQQRY